MPPRTKKGERLAAVAGPHMYADWLTLQEFSDLKGVNVSNVLRAIHAGKIVPVFVGRSKTPFIDLVAYADYKFREYRFKNQQATS